MLPPIVEIKPAPALDSAPALPRLELNNNNLFNIAEWQHEIPWQPFKERHVEIPSCGSTMATA